jgi:hypothetical protein
VLAALVELDGETVCVDVTVTVMVTVLAPEILGVALTEPVPVRDSLELALGELEAVAAILPEDVTEEDGEPLEDGDAELEIL